MQMNALLCGNRQIYYFKNFYFSLKICEEIPYQKIFLNNFSTPQGVHTSAKMATVENYMHFNFCAWNFSFSIHSCVQSLGGRVSWKSQKYLLPNHCTWEDVLPKKMNRANHWFFNQKLEIKVVPYHKSKSHNGLFSKKLHGKWIEVREQKAIF